MINNDEYDRQIGGIGKVTEQTLKGVFGINSCEQMLEKASYLCALFSQSTAGYLSVQMLLFSILASKISMQVIFTVTVP